MSDLNDLVTYLYAIEDWLRESCTARHNDDMADAVRKAADMLDDLADERADNKTLCQAEGTNRPCSSSGA